MKNLKFLSLALLFSSFAIAGTVEDAKSNLNATQSRIGQIKAEHSKLLKELDGHQNALSGLKGNADKAAEINKHNDAIRAKTERVNALTKEHQAHTDKLRKHVAAAKGTHYVKHNANGKYEVCNTNEAAE